MKNQIERVEPSRGAPDATARGFWLAEPDPDKWESEFEFAEAYAKSRHVVLLEALQRLVQCVKEECAPWPKLDEAVAEADAVIRKAERL